MSLIHQALKKIENNRQGHDFGGASPDGGHANSSERAGMRPVLLGIGSAVAALILAAIFMHYRPAFAPAPAQTVALTPAKEVLQKKTEDTQTAQAQQKPAVPASADDETEAEAETEAKQTAPLAQPAVQNDAEIRNKRGVSQYKSGMFIEAAEEFKAAVAGETDAARKSVYYNNLGQARAKTEEYGEAESAFKSALKMNPAYPEALNNYGALMLKKGDYAKALDLFAKAKSQKPGYAEAYLNAAVSLEYMGRHSEAIKAYEEFLEINERAPAGLRLENTQEIQKRLRRLKTSTLSD